MPNHLTKRPCALILGASRGLGQRLAFKTRQRGLISVEISRSTVNSYAGLEEGSVTCRADIADPTAILDILDLHRKLPITHVFWVAGIHRKQSMMAATYEDVDLMTRTHFTGPVNIGNPGEFSMLELAENVIRLSDSKSALEFRPPPSDDPRQRKPDIALAKSKLGWEPKVGLDEGLKETNAYFRRTL